MYNRNIYRVFAIWFEAMELTMMCSSWGTAGGWQAEDLVSFQAVRANQRGDDNNLP